MLKVYCILISSVNAGDVDRQDMHIPPLVDPLDVLRSARSLKSVVRRPAKNTIFQVYTVVRKRNGEDESG